MCPFSVALQGPVQNFCSGKGSHEPGGACQGNKALDWELSVGTLGPQTKDRLMMSRAAKLPKW